MSTTDVAVIETNLPAALQEKLEQYRAEFDAGAFDGASIPEIKLSGKQFVVKVDGETVDLGLTTFGAAIVRVRADIYKNWYAKKFNPNDTRDTFVAPDCFSNDGVRPDSTCASPQNAACAGCPKNEFGSGTDANGDSTKGKACGDRRIIALYVPAAKAIVGHTVFRFGVPAGSIGAFNSYRRDLKRRQASLPFVMTKIGFDPSVSYAVVTFMAAGAVPQKNLGDVMEKIESAEAEAAISFEMKNRDADTQGKIAEKPAEKPEPAKTVEPVEKAPTAPGKEAVVETEVVPTAPVEGVVVTEDAGMDMGFGAEATTTEIVKEDPIVTEPPSDEALGSMFNF